MRRVAALGAPLVFVVAGGTACTDGGPAVRAADAAVGANPGDSAALYVDLTAEGSDDRLTSATCDCARSTSLHVTEDRYGILLMLSTTSIELPAGDTVDLSPGGSHVMLEDLDSPLIAGSTIEVTLGFERSPELLLDVPVVALEELAERVTAPGDPGDGAGGG